MIVLIKLLAIFIISLLSVLPILSHSSECVVLLHGLARTENSMSKLESKLKSAGYNTVNQSYPSRKFSVDVLANKAIPKAINRCGDADSIHFVTHSMGGILVRQYLSKHQIKRLQHVVMLGPPNQGSEVVDRLSDVPGFKIINGPAGLQLGTGELSTLNSLGPARFSLGVIAGSKSLNFILSSFIQGENDGKVSVEKTKLEGMSDHLVMPVTHTFMMKNSDVIDQVKYYLKHGEFRKIDVQINEGSSD